MCDGFRWWCKGVTGAGLLLEMNRDKWEKHLIKFKRKHVTSYKERGVSPNLCMMAYRKTKEAYVQTGIYTTNINQHKSMLF